MRYNCPHKVSMCIISERPVIIWKESAIADYIVNNNLGVAIASLEEIPDIIHKISDDKYQIMKRNVQALKLKLMRGDSLGTVLNKLNIM